MSPTAPPNPATAEETARARAWWAVSFLTGCYALSVIDRSILAFVAPSLQRDLHLTDLQLGWLQGFAFSITYAVAGLPLGTAVDRYRRTWIVVIAVAVWSGMTVFSGLATGFAMLFLARIGVGIGEAGLAPAAYSLMGDLFSKRRLPAAATLYSFGPTIASGGAALLSGLILGRADGAGIVHLPGIGALAAWRAVLLAVGVPGFLVAALGLLFREPERRRVLGAPQQGRLLPFAIRNWRLHLTVMAASTFGVLAAYAASAWLPSILTRDFRWPAGRIGATLGTVALLAGSAGVALAGGIASWSAAKGRAERMLHLASAIMLCEAAIGALVLEADTGRQVLALAVVTSMLAPMLFMLPAIALQLVTPPTLRGRVTALGLFIGVGIGTGAGPTIVGAVSTLVFGDRDLAGALGAVLIIAGVVGAALFASAARPMRRWLQAGEQ